MMRQQAGVSAAAAAAFYGSSGMLPRIPCSNVQRSMLPTLSYTSSAATPPTSYRSTNSSFSAPLPAVSCSSSSCYGDALSPVNSCHTSFSGGLISPGTSATTAAGNVIDSLAALCAGGGLATGSSPAVSPRAQAKIQELMVAQQMQLEIQDELLQMLSLRSSHLN
jgi:hypothetical protein